MQTYSHLLIGAALGITLFPDDTPAQVSCMVGSGLPDIPAILKIVSDKLEREKPFLQQSRFFWHSKGASHSLLIAAIFYGLMSLVIAKLAWPLLLGWISHSLIDAFTHGNEFRFGRDPSIFWPLPKTRIEKLVGLLEYRRAHGVFAPKWWEAAIDCILLVLLIIS